MSQGKSPELAPKNSKHEKPRPEMELLWVFFSRFFILNHLVDCLNLTLDISRQVLNINNVVLFAVYIDKIEREKNLISIQGKPQKKFPH